MLDVVAEVAMPKGVTGGDAVVIGVVIVGFNAVVDLARYGMSRRRNGKKNNAVICPHADRHSGLLVSIHEKLAKTDSSGTPLVYGHHRLVEKLDEILNELRKLVSSQKE